MLIGYARCSDADESDEDEQRADLVALGVPEDHIHVDRGLTGKDRDRPGLAAALTSVESGDVLVVTRLERLARSVADLGEAVATLEQRGVRLMFDGTTYDPSEPKDRIVFRMLGRTFAEFESGLIHLRTADGVAAAKAAGRYRGRKLLLTAEQQREMFDLKTSGAKTVAELEVMFGLSQPAVYKYLQREQKVRSGRGPR
ncbi:recombinase family protein [Rhodococcus sp. ACT016]|uniref:recombinase family protein n=1 Tax=Rhodococcus sp. ACT016 TaxID=3134808 RepID=UPI003D26CDA9